MNNLKKWDQFLNEGIFDFFKRNKFEKIEKLMKKMEADYDKLVDEAGGEENLSRGVRLGYDNFGNFVDNATEIVEIIKEDIEENGSKNREDIMKYKDILLRMVSKLRMISSVRGVSELSVSQLKFVNRNVVSILKWIG